MKAAKEEALLEAVRNKFPEQARSLESYIWAGWEFDGHGSSDSVNIKRKLETAYIRADGTMRY